MTPLQKEELLERLSLPVIGSPMFIVSEPGLVIEQCKAGIIGAFPALNARPAERLDDWLFEIEAALEEERRAHPEARVAPFAVNQIVHASNTRLEHDLELCVRHRVPIIITSLRSPQEVVAHVHGYGGYVFHDVISVRHAEKAIEAGVDGLILVCAGAGGHAGTLSPFALLPEVRRLFDGMVILSGSIANGSSILAAEAAGADLAYIGTRFIATREARAAADYKQMLVESSASDIVYTSTFTGVHGNYLKKSIVRAGLDPDNLGSADKNVMNFSSGGISDAKAWKDIWGAGQGVGQIDDVPSTAQLVERLKEEYQAARRRLFAA